MNIYCNQSSMHSYSLAYRDSVTECDQTLIIIIIDENQKLLVYCKMFAGVLAHAWLLANFSSYHC